MHIRFINFTKIVVSVILELVPAEFVWDVYENVVDRNDINKFISMY